MRKPIIAGNWKMNKGVSETLSFIAELRAAITAKDNVETLACPPFVALSAAKYALAGSAIKLGAQNCHPEAKGAFTGEVSIAMLPELVEYVIIGHSERRAIFGEKDDFINKKVHAILAAGLKPILCIGETLAENEAGQTEAVLERQTKAGLNGVSAEQIAKVVSAYEPVWAIGTGRAATSADAQNRCAFIRGELRKLYGGLADEVRIQYGGSVTAANAKEILSQPDIDGALVGGASLKTADFKAIVEAA
jgi:triosephosphate isomerase